MQPRERNLAIGFLAVILLWQGGGAVFGWVFGPFSERYRERKTLQDKVAERTREQLALVQAQARLSKARQRGLPPDPGAATAKKPTARDGQRLYQEWLTHLTAIAGWENVKVRPLPTGLARGNVYISVPITIEAEARYSQLARFLDLFHQTDLLHRISKLHVVSSESDGDPFLRVNIDAEALALTKAPHRKVLFPTANIGPAVSDDDTTVTVDSLKNWPAKAPYYARLGRELVQVTAVNGTALTITRGQLGTKAQDHPQNGLLELLPIVAGKPTADARLQELLDANIFIKPRPPVPYRLKPPSLSEKSVIRGQTLDVSAAATGFDPALGKPSYSLDADAAPAGMSIDAATGKLTWKAPADAPLEKLSIPITIRHPSADDGVARATLVVNVKEANKAPTIAAAAPSVAVIGRPWECPLVLSDNDTAIERLTLKLGDGSPAGLTVDQQSQKLVWLPDGELLPGEYPVTVTVTDTGTPPLSASTSLTVMVEDDRAVFTYLIGVVSEDGTSRVLLFDRSKNRTTVLRVGDMLTISDVRGRVSAIEPKALVLTMDDGDFRLEIGQHLRQLQPLAAPTTSAPLAPGTPPEPALPDDPRSSSADEAQALR
jgi:hypothetical protein